MAAIGSLVFCTDCGNLLDGSSGDENAILKCDVCGTENRGIAPSIIPFNNSMMFHRGTDAAAKIHHLVPLLPDQSPQLSLPPSAQSCLQYRL